MKDNENIEQKSQEIENNKDKDEFITSEAPPGRIVEVPKENILNEISFKEYEIKGNNNILYDLKIFRNEKSISFHLRGKSVFDKIYKKELTLEEFFNLNKFFRQYLSLEDLFDDFFKNLKNTEISIPEITENNNILKLILIIEVRGNKEEIPFTLEKNMTENEMLIFNLNEYIKEIELQKKSNEKILKEFKEIKSKLDKSNNLNKIFFSSFIILLFCFLFKIVIKNPIKNEIDIIKNDVQNIKIFNNEINKIIAKRNFKSKIIRYRELDFIEDKIQKKYNKKIIKYELLFRASRDGFSSRDFQKKCNGKTDTITFVKTGNNNRFGGFTKLAFNDPERLSFKEDFTFSVDNYEIYNYQQNKGYYNKKYSYGNFNIEGPYFEGSYGFIIGENSNINRVSQDYSKVFTKNKNYNYNNNEMVYYNEGPYFIVKDYEIFKIYLE